MDLVFTAGSNNGAMQCIDIDVDIIDSPEDETFTVTLTATNSIVTFSNYVTTINIADTASKYEKDATTYTRIAEDVHGWLASISGNRTSLYNFLRNAEVSTYTKS